VRHMQGCSPDSKQRTVRQFKGEIGIDDHHLPLSHRPLGRRQSLPIADLMPRSFSALAAARCESQEKDAHGQWFVEPAESHIPCRCGCSRQRSGDATLRSR
jgi:hypothetical protein